MTAIKYKNFYIDKKEINLPYVILNNGKKNTVLITGGIDGDEYSGIKAAYNLIEILKNIELDYRIIILPLVNIFGNKEGVSYNPIDGKFPKYIYPGKKNGSSSEQLIYQIHEFIEESFLWIDLHSGSTEEILKPFIWTWESKIKKVNEKTISFLSKLYDQEIIYEKNHTKKVDELAKRKISYIMLESGQLGKEKSEDINKHIEWVKKIISTSNENNTISVYKRVKFLKATESDYWKPEIFPGKINEKDLIGYLGLKKILSEKTGSILYMRKSMILEKGDEFLAIAYDRINI